ncbi:MAG: hypothetical protein J3R72DRAFT_207446 [Linnemannia gamsii]|nr:MAG: hypothetical protein J3R72DRAFT_207446 [Linnemannia gamsii]
MASKQGQILYLGGSSGTQGGPGGSLSTRFQKLSQSRSSGVTIVDPTTGVTTNAGGAGRGGGIDARLGRSLGLGFGTGSHPQGSGHHRISTGAARGGLSTGRGNRTGGLHTPGGLARAMQERGTGVSDAFLFAPAAMTAGGGGGGGPVNRRGRKQDNTAAAGGAAGGTRASRHKALMLGGRPGRRQQNAAPAVPTPQQQRQRGGPQARGAAAGGKSAAANSAKAAAKVVGGAAGAQGAKAGEGKKGKKGGKAAKPTPANAGDLDSQLDEYMMKDGRTAASVLDNDLDSYMADKPADW